MTCAFNGSPPNREFTKTNTLTDNNDDDDDNSNNVEEDGPPMGHPCPPTRERDERVAGDEGTHGGEVQSYKYKSDCLYRQNLKISDLRLDRMGDGYGTVCTDHGPRDRHRLHGRRMQRASRRASSRAARSIANGREKGLRSWHFAMGTIGEIWGLGEICIPQGLSLRNHLRYDYMSAAS